MKKLLPPVLFLFCVIFIALVYWKYQLKLTVLYPYNVIIGLPFVLIGVGISSWNSRLFSKLQTNIMTFDEPDILVMEGMYKYTRNPMYLGFVLALFGTAILFQGSFFSFIIVLLFFDITNCWYIKYEEKRMKSKFGKSYETYCENVRRWI